MRIGGIGSLDRVTPRRKKGPAKPKKKNANTRPKAIKPRPTKPKSKPRGY